jgi:hypothetical protein
MFVCATHRLLLLLQARVSSMGGKIVYKAGSHRVMGLLAMSRALGDHFLRPYVIPEPEVGAHSLQHLLLDGSACVGTPGRSANLAFCLVCPSPWLQLSAAQDEDMLLSSPAACLSVSPADTCVP